MDWSNGQPLVCPRWGDWLIDCFIGSLVGWFICWAGNSYHFPRILQNIYVPLNCRFRYWPARQRTHYRPNARLVVFVTTVASCSPTSTSLKIAGKPLRLVRFGGIRAWMQNLQWAWSFIWVADSVTCLVPLETCLFQIKRDQKKKKKKKFSP